MSTLGAILFTVGLFGVVAWMIAALVSRLREERQRQPLATRTPMWRVVAAAVAAAGVLAAIGIMAGWEIASVFRLAMAGVVVASVIRYAHTQLASRSRTRR